MSQITIANYRLNNNIRALFGGRMSETIKVAAAIPAEPSKIYDAWLNSRKHSSMTGGEAKASAMIGGRFTAWDKYISGKNIDLVKNKRIVQTWRGTDFPPGSNDSILIVRFEKVESGTKVFIVHSEIPDGMGKSYKDGWRDFYFKPMKKYFSK